MQTEQEVLACSTCYPTVKDLEHALYTALPNSYPAMSPEDQISELLGTVCGAEFMFNTYPDYDIYVRSQQGTYL